MMRKKMLAALTAAVCMTAALPAVSQPVSAAYAEDYCVISIDYAEGTDTPETYLLLDVYDSAYEVTAADMELYLTEDSALPQVGDVVEVYAGSGTLADNQFWHFSYADDSYIEVIGTAEAYYSLHKDYMVIRCWEDENLYLLQDMETGDECSYEVKTYDGYTTPYQMEGAQVGDTVSFYMFTMDIDFEMPFLPYAVTKGDGTVPDMPDSEITENYFTDTVIVVGESYSYQSEKPDTYLVLSGTTPLTIGRDDLLTHGDVEDLECGDVLMIDVTAYVEEYPMYAGYPKNGKFYRIGNAADLYGTGDFTVTENTGTQLILEDAEGNTKQYTYKLADMGYSLFHSDAQNAKPGDILSFTLNGGGNPVIPVTDTEEVNPVDEYVVIGVDDTENPQNFILLNPVRQRTYHLSAELLAQCLTDGEEMPAFGDILEMTGHVLSYFDLFTRTRNFALQLYGENLGTLVNDGQIRKVGSVYDNYTETVLKYRSSGAFSYDFCNLSDTNYNYTTYTTDFLQTYVQPGCADLTAMHYGDEITMVVYNGCPVFPSDTVSPLGDANQDGALDVLDVVTLNKNIMGVASLPGAAARSGDFGQADFNGDGAIDGMDSLGVMKRIVGLE